MAEDGKQQLSVLRNLARHQSLLVENHQALLLQVSRIASQLQNLPRIRLNSREVTQTEVMLTVGINFSLSCTGDPPISWAMVPPHCRKQTYEDKIIINYAIAHCTGTYRCKTQQGIYSDVYLYVKDRDDLFTPQLLQNEVKKEGSSHLFDCRLTDPRATDFSLLLGNGSTVPRGMRYVADPKGGIIVKDLLPQHSGNYKCSARIDGVQKFSSLYHLSIIEKVRTPPAISAEQDRYVRCVGETLEISCTFTNPNFVFTVTWTHSSGQKNKVRITSIVKIKNATLSDSGNFTCTASNEAGFNSSTIHLQVIDEPYIRLRPIVPDQQGRDIKINEGENLELDVEVESYPEIESQWWDTPTHENSRNASCKNTLRLKRIRAEERGQYTLHARSSRVYTSISFNVSVHQKPRVVGRWENRSLTCSATGFPLPSIYWYQCSNIQTICNGSDRVSLPAQTVLVMMGEQGPVRAKSTPRFSQTNSTITLECIATNIAGEDRTTFVMVIEVWHSQVFTPSLMGASGLALVLLLILVVVFYKYKQKPKFEIRWKIIEANDGNNYTFVDPSQLPYNEKWEFPRDKLKFGHILGAGAFGKVVEATAYGLGTDEIITRVAVKMLKPSAHSEEREALMSELKILSHLGPHDNIVNLLGACTQGGPMLMITEYCSHGDLLNFLRSRGEMFIISIISEHGSSEDSCLYKNISKQEVRIRSDSGISCSAMWNAVMGRINTSVFCGPSLGCSYGSETEMNSLGLEDLIRFSYEVAQGMDFLASRNCIHRDVAARNVLLTECCVAKICDFGLARDIMNDSNYVVKGNARLPVKWMSPESIFDCVYTVQSDVWSYGIMLWEIFSLGKSPYPEIMVDPRFYKMIKDGYHMSSPDFAPPEIYNIMEMCWNLEPTLRPTFSKVGQLIEKLLPGSSFQVSNKALIYTILCDSPSACEESCDQSPDHGAEQQPLMKNNYQFC
uniref:receptor protein-tyrosine kinase n=1 Tax=Denticeps clupeoides TaxID=299321 RepID=A0AAY4B9T6_9TELE